MTPKIVTLKDRGLISISGEESQKFLQDLVTADVDALAAGDATYASLLTPQGKVLFDFFIIAETHGYLIDCVLTQREALSKRLTFYKLRARIAIAAIDNRRAVAVLEGGVPNAIRDPRTAAMGQRFYEEPGNGDDDTVSYHRRRIVLGLAEGGQDFDSGEIFPHEANFDQIGAMSFRKGCFVGQEVVSRIEHRGTARSRILPCRVEGALPAKGSDISAGGKVIGRACSGAGDRVLALLRLDRLEEMRRSGTSVSAAGSTLFPESPPWAHFTVPAFG
ncbi:MAG: YgfZ/GcvT domain-containing protein [Aestuariivirgaceae bacterium]